MFTQVLQATVKPKRLAEFRHGVAHHAMPAIRRQPGFVDALTLFSANNFLCVTFWRSQHDSERFTAGVLPRILARTEPLLVGLARTEIFKVTSDTIHEREETERKTEAAGHGLPAVA